MSKDRINALDAGIEQRIIELMRSCDIEFCLDADMSRHSTFNIGGVARILALPKNQQSLRSLLHFCIGENVRYALVGKGANLLFAFEHFRGVMVSTQKLCEIRREEESLVAGCGASLARLCQAAHKEGLSGLEFAFGIPGTCGGAVFMNAGAYGSQMSEVVSSSLAYDTIRDETLRLFGREEHEFAYRQSVYMRRPELVCLEARFSLAADDIASIAERMQKNMAARREKQPLDYPSAGSYFKRPEGYFAGKLIEDCGLGGMRVGGAEVSRKHCGFIINVGGATYGDVLALEEKIKESVLHSYGVLLEREVCVIE